MRLSGAELAELLSILEKIDRGVIHPRMPGRIGRFLRQYTRARVELDRVLAQRRLYRRRDAAISGRALGAVEIHPILKPEVSLLASPLGEVAVTVAISEELGGLTGIVTWLKGSVASTAFNKLRRSTGLRLTGDYRWYPPARLTPGEAQLEPSASRLAWQHARCLKAVADDLTRPPHALEYVLDYRMGPPGLKYFRSVSAWKRGQKWLVLGAMTQPRPLDIAAAVPDTHLDTSELSALLIYSEPWSRAWTIVAAHPISEADSLAHAIAWADFRRELDGHALDAEVIARIRDTFRAAGLEAEDFGEPDLTQHLFPIARDILRWLRGSP